MSIRSVSSIYAAVVFVSGLSTVVGSSTARAQAAGKIPPTKPPAGQQGLPDLSKLPKSIKVPETFEGLFAERDERSKTAIGYLRCMQSTIGALQSGRLGNVPKDWSITCVEEKGEWRGVFGQLTDGSIDVKLQVAYRGANAAITSAAIDTARVNGTARALLRGLAAPLPGNGKYEFTPIPMSQGTFVEVWFLPVPSDPTKAIVGGDSLIQMSADGVRELGHARDTPPIRLMPVPLNVPTWTLMSIEQRIPSLSELIVARMALDIVPEVHVLTNQYESVLTRAAKGWTHHRR